jgi:hypothetical protein
MDFVTSAMVLYVLWLVPARRGCNWLKLRLPGRPVSELVIDLSVGCLILPGIGDGNRFHPFLGRSA